MKNDHSRIKELFVASGQRFESEDLALGGEHRLTIYFFRHASLALLWDGFLVYVDPIAEYADYSRLPKADLVLVTHEHYDHLDVKAVEALRGGETVVVGSPAAAGEMVGAEALPHGRVREVADGVSVESVPAYNVSPHQLQFHPRERGDNGYVVAFGPTRVYIAGDTEPTPEMGRLGKIDIAFIPVNQPYTMTLEQAAGAVRIIKPGIFFPYHTTDTDIVKIVPMLADVPSVSVRIHEMP